MSKRIGRWGEVGIIFAVIAITLFIVGLFTSTPLLIFLGWVVIVAEVLAFGAGPEGQPMKLIRRYGKYWNDVATTHEHKGHLVRATVTGMVMLVLPIFAAIALFVGLLVFCTNVLGWWSLALLIPTLVWFIAWSVRTQ